MPILLLTSCYRKCCYEHYNYMPFTGPAHNFFYGLPQKLEFLGPGKMHIQFYQVLPDCFFRKVASFCIVTKQYLSISLTLFFIYLFFLPTFGIVCLSNLCQIMDITWYLIIILTYISLITSEVSHLHKFACHLGFLFHILPVYMFAHLSVSLFLKH